MLSDTGLIEAFFEASIRGQETLLANKHFLAESRFGVNQLASKQAGILVKVNVKQQPIQFWVRQSAPNREVLEEVLQRQQFLVTGKQSDDGFSSYQYFPVKPGYTLNCQSARTLWKNWRTLQRLSENMSQAQKLLVKGGHDWEQIKRITVSSDLLFIETPAGETTSHIDESITWLSEVQSAPPDQPAGNKVKSASPTQPAEAVVEYVGFSDGYED
ncbi:MAG: hypothetical protein AAGE59_17275 [Cyanobacteria bacterium P01_F01_bin.86]